jgi:hypothetical protein
MTSNPEPRDRAITEYRAAHPEDDDLPDDRLAKLLVVQQRALGIAVTDLWYELRDALVRDWRKIIAVVVAVWVVVFAVDLFL